MPVDRPRPTPRGEERTFFEDARAGRLCVEECADCGARTAYPRVVCRACGSDRLWRFPAGGGGEVYSYTTLQRAGHPAFVERVPYTVVLVDLDEGVRVLADLVDGSGEPSIGMRVRAVFEPVSDELTLPRFTPEPVVA